MKPQHIIRAWKDAEYLASLSLEEQAALPENPAGVLALNDEDLSAASGGYFSVFSCPTPLCTTGNFCYSLGQGGTCHNWSLGCCDPENQI
jgi:mersacidin/lichenicidin family type 2 lantibiotic